MRRYSVLASGSSTLAAAKPSCARPNRHRGHRHNRGCGNADRNPLDDILPNLSCSLVWHTAWHSVLRKRVVMPVLSASERRGPAPARTSR